MGLGNSNAKIPKAKNFCDQQTVHMNIGAYSLYIVVGNFGLTEISFLFTGMKSFATFAKHTKYLYMLSVHFTPADKTIHLMHFLFDSNSVL